MKLLEGGNVFKDADGNPLTQRINQSDVAQTIQWLETVTGLELPRSRWLGSTGRSTTSGDLDIAVDVNDMTKDELYARLVKLVQSHGQDPRQWVKKAGEVHFRTPINGNPNNGYVQADFMFMPNVDWGTFYYSGSSPGYKGMVRNVLLSSLGKPMGYKVGLNGMIDRATNELIKGGQDPDTVAKLLLNKSASAQDLASVESIYQALASDKNRAVKLADFQQYLEREGLTEPGTVTEHSEVGFLARLRDRIVNLGHQALIEHHGPVLVEAKDPRIPYVEDFVFKKGLQGARQAIDILKHTADNTRDYATIKWDGSPAVIFGRKPSGEFVLTDKAGATAVGYDGLATSPDMMSAIMKQRDANAQARGKTSDRGVLSDLYQTIWPYFEAAVPENFRGYLKGDLLFYPGRPWQEDAGNLVFQPNQHGGIVYRIPANSELGQQIAASRVGVVIHSQMADPSDTEQPVKDPSGMLKPVPGLLITSAVVKNLQNLKLDRNSMSELRALTSGANAQALDQLLKPQDLRAAQITDLPALMERYINSLKGTDYTDANPNGFLSWLQTQVNERKFNNVYGYLTSPRSNVLGMAVAFNVWNSLHAVKQDMQRQLDLQQPGQEGWVLATPAGRAKLVSRTAGGFADPERKAQAKS